MLWTKNKTSVTLDKYHKESIENIRKILIKNEDKLYNNPETTTDEDIIKWSIDFTNFVLTKKGDILL